MKNAELAKHHGACSTFGAYIKPKSSFKDSAETVKDQVVPAVESGARWGQSHFTRENWAPSCPQISILAGLCPLANTVQKYWKMVLGFRSEFLGI